MRVFQTREFVGGCAWDALDLGTVEGASARLHWADAPYVWHINDGEEIFFVIDGRVQMQWRDNGQEHSALLGPGDAVFAETGEEHLATPLVPSRILVIERLGSL